MRTVIKNYVGCLLMLVSTSNIACKKESNREVEGAQDGYVSGKIADTQNNPLANIEVVFENILVGNHNYVAGVSDEKGMYKIKLPKVGTYHGAAYIKKTFNGKIYEMSLHPDNDEVIGNTGAVVNFQWKLSGPRSKGLDGFYGGSVEIHNHPGRPIVDEQNIEFTFTPIGKLIDGSDGQTIKRKSGLPQTIYYGRLTDIPIGRYQVSAVYINGGQRIPLGLRELDSADPYSATYTLNFEPTTIAGDNMAFIQYDYE